MGRILLTQYTALPVDVLLTNLLPALGLGPDAVLQLANGFFKQRPRRCPSNNK